LRSAAYLAPCMQQGGLSAAHPAALNSPGVRQSNRTQASNK